jgi:transcriptional regulator with XRE-family HTH domain
VRIDGELADQAVLAEIGQRIARARLEQNIGQAELGDVAGVGVATVQRLEGGRSVALTSLIRILRALGLLDALDRGLPELLPSPIDQLRLRSGQRQRAQRGHSTGETTGHPDGWRWGDEQDAAER